MNHINFETDLLKHYVRRYGWLPASQQQRQTVRKRLKKIPLRYFTFCASEAIDVFMLEREGILKRSEKTGRLEGVYFCEEDSHSFGKISDLIGSPEQGFQGKFEEIVLFEDSEETIGKTLVDENFYVPEIREKLICKDAHCRLREAFPFDIINLDVFGVMFPPRKGVITPLLESILKILDWQTTSSFSIKDHPCNQFTLFLTSHIDRALTDETAIGQLANRVRENIRTNGDFRITFAKRYGHAQVDQLVDENFAEFFCVALPKFMIQEVLFKLGWTVTSGPTYLYNRDDKWDEKKQYQIMHAVSVYKRIPDFQQRLDHPGPGEYIETVTKLVKDGVQSVDEAIKNSDITRELAEDLKHIVELRNQHQKPIVFS